MLRPTGTPRALFVSSFMLVLSVVLWLNFSELTAAELSEWLFDLGLVGVLAICGLMALAALTPLPAEVVAITAGLVYGPLLGSGIIWTGAMLGALAAFEIGRLGSLSLPHSNRLVSPAIMRRVRAFDQAGPALFMARLIPLLPFFALNYAAGLSGMRRRTYTIATATGILPLTLLLVLGGHGLATTGWMWPVALIGLTVAVIASGAVAAAGLILRHTEAIPGGIPGSITAGGNRSANALHDADAAAPATGVHMR